MSLVNIDYQRFRWHLLILSLLQICMSSGMIYGFSSLRDILKRHKVDDHLDLVTLGQMGVTAVALSQFLSGILLDAVGPKICSGLCMLLLSLGSFLLSLGLQYHKILYIACILIGIGGPGTQASTIHVSALFPKHRGLAVSFQIGAFQVSILLFLIVKRLCIFGLSFQLLLVSVAICQMALAVISFIVWPMKPFETHTVLDIGKTVEAGEAPPALFKFRIDRGAKALQTRTTLCSQMFTSSYFAMIVFLPMVMLYLNSFLILTREQVSCALGTAADESRLQMYTDMSQILLLCGVLANTIFGIAIDRFGIVKSGFLVIFFMLSYSIALLLAVGREWLLVVAFSLYPVTRSCFFAWVFFVLSFDFGYKNFGMLSGVLFLINSIIFLAHGFIFRTIFGASVSAWNMSQLAVAVLMISIPLYWLQRGVSNKNCSRSKLPEV